MPMVTLHKMGSGNVYHLHVLDAVDPGYGRPDWEGRPDNTLPGGGGHPGNRPPGSWEGRPDNTLPGGGHISNRPPGSGNPAFPDNTLPSGPPPHVSPGTTLILVRDAQGIWHYAAIQPGQPVPPPLPGHALPGGPPPMPGTLPGQTPQPKPA